jgi:UDP-2-acetamido-3-amino-2,3-dideoxy-glucuronate N-acetyltransferase
MIHKLADVASKQIGVNTAIWQYAIILEGAVIGDYCNINCHTFIENDVILGDRVTVKSGVYLWDGLRVEDDVFIGPNATFINDLLPKSKVRPPDFLKTVLKKGCSIGANATIMGGITIGENAMVGAGSLVLSDVSPNAIMVGSPAKRVGWIDGNGVKMKKAAVGKWVDSDNSIYEEFDNMLILLADK